MTARTFTRSLALLAGGAVLVAACGGGTATTGPGGTIAPVVTQAPVTQAPATQGPAGTSGPGFSFDTSSFHADVELEALFPDEIAGAAMTPLSMSGPEIVGDGSAPELSATLVALGKTPADLTAAFGFAGDVSIVAFRVQGVPGGNILTALFQAFEQEAGTTVTDASFGGKAVKKITPGDSDDSIGYVYTAQDVVFLVSADDDALLNEAFSKLP